MAGHAFDHQLMFRSVATNLTQTETSSGIKLRGTPVKGLAARIEIPSTTGTTNDLLAVIQVSDDDSTYTLLSTYEGGATSWASGGKSWIIPFSTRKKYARLVMTVGGSTGTPSFGAVQAGVVQFAQNLYRDKDFSV